MSDIYRIAVGIALTSNHAGVLGALSSQLLHVHGQMGKLHDEWSRVKLAMAGGLAIAGGGELLKVAEHIESAGEKLVHAQTVFAAGLPAHDRAALLAQATAAAWAQAGKNMNTSVSGNLEAIHDIYNVVQDLPHALDLLPAFTQLQTALSSIKDGTSIGEAASAKNVASAVRAFELMGKTDPHALEEMTKDFTKTTIALRGRVDGQNFLTAVQGAGDARYGWNEQFASQGFPALVNAMGTKAGNLMNMLNNNLYGGVASSGIQAGYQIQYGLHEKRDLEANGKAFKPGTVFEGSLLRSNPLEWANHYREHLRGMGFNVDDLKTMQDIVARVGRGNRSVKAALDELLLPMTNRQLNKEVGNIGKVGDDAAGVLSGNDPKLLRDALHKQWENLMEALGSPMVKPAMEVLKQVTATVSEFAQLAAQNPDAVLSIGKGVVILGAALTGAGAAALLAAIGPVGWLVGGVTAMVGAWATVDATGFKATVSALTDAARSLYRGISGFSFDPETVTRLSMFYALAKSEALIIFNHMKALAIDPKNLEMIHATLASTGQEYEALKAGLGKVLDWYTTILGWRQTAQDAIMSLLGGLGGAGGVEHPGMSESAREGLAGRAVDPMGVLVTKLLNVFKSIDGALLQASETLAKEIQSWPGRLSAAIAEMGSNLVTMIGDMLRSLVNKLNPFSRTSLEGDGGGIGSMIQRASFTTGGGANDNFGSASGVARALGHGGAGGGGTALGSLGAGGDYVANVGGRSYRAAYQAGGRERVGSWLDMLQRPVANGGLGMPLDKARAMVAMMQGESGINLNPGAIGDHGTSIGTAQWHGPRARQLLALAQQMGLPWRDVRVQQQMFRNEMLGAYRRRVYDPIMAGPGGDHALGVGIDHFESPAKKALAYRFRHPYLQGLRRSGAGEHAEVPTAGPPPRQKEETHIHNVYMDGEKIERHVTRRMVAKARFPTSVGGPDTHGSWHGPATAGTKVA